MDVNAIARALVTEMSEAVAKHVHPKSGDLVPPKLTGQQPVRDLKIGERVIDRADELITDECEAWLPGRDPEVYLELVQEEKRWIVSWVIDSEGDAPSEAPSEAEEES